MTEEHRRPATTARSRSTSTEPRERTSDDSPFAQAQHTVGEAIRIIILRRWAFFVPFCIVSTLAALISHQIPRLYEVSTVFERRENPVLQNLPAGTAIRLVKDSRPTVTRDLQDLDLMEEVMGDAGLTPSSGAVEDGPLSPEVRQIRRAMAARFASGVSVNLRSFTAESTFDTITITCESRDPTHLAPVCNALRDRYITRTRARMTQRLKETCDYFAEQVSLCQSRISELNRSRLGGVLENTLVDLADPQSIANRMQRLHNEREALLHERDDLEIRIEAHEDNLSRLQQLARRSPAGGETTGAPTLFRSPQAIALQTEIDELDVRILAERHEHKKTLKHPDVVELLRTRTVLQDRLTRQMEADALTASMLPASDTLPLPLAPAGNDVFLAQISNLEMELKTLRGQLQRTARSLGVVEADLKDYESKKDEVFASFQAREDVSDALRAAQQELLSHQSTLSKLESLLTADENERAVGFTVISPARAALVPSSPKANVVLLITLLLGAACGACGVLLAEIFDRSFHTTRHVTRALGLSILECIDEIVTAADRARQFRRRVVVAPVLVLAMLAAVFGSHAMSYLSLRRPHTYRDLLALPQKAWQEAAAWIPSFSDPDGDAPPQFAEYPDPTTVPTPRLASRPGPLPEGTLYYSTLNAALGLDQAIHLDSLVPPTGLPR